MQKTHPKDRTFRQLHTAYTERLKASKEHGLAQAAKSFAGDSDEDGDEAASPLEEIEYGLAEIPRFGPGFRDANALNLSLTTVLPLRPCTTKRQNTLGGATWGSSQDRQIETRMAHRGVGLTNQGNTCFVNSVLQALTFTAPLTGYLRSLRPDAERQKLQQYKQEKQLRAQQHKVLSPVSFCMLAEMELHVRRVMVAAKPFYPDSIIWQLKTLSGQFENGMQEDAHKFLVHVLDAMTQSCLNGLVDSVDSLHKYTDTDVESSTLVHHIFAGKDVRQVVAGVGVVVVPAAAAAVVVVVVVVVVAITYRANFYTIFKYKTAHSKCVRCTRSSASTVVTLARLQC